MQENVEDIAFSHSILHCLLMADVGMRTWTEASKLMGAFCKKASAGVSSSLLHKESEVYLQPLMLLLAKHIVCAACLCCRLRTG